MPHLKDRELKAGALSRTNWVRKDANDALHLLTSVEFLSRRVPATQRDTPSAKTVRRARKKSVVKKHHRQISPIVPASRINTSVKHTWKLSSGVSPVVLQRAYVHRNLVSVVQTRPLHFYILGDWQWICSKWRATCPLMLSFFYPFPLSWL